MNTEKQKTKDKGELSPVKRELIERLLALTPAQLEKVIEEWERQELIERENGHIKPALHKAVTA